MTIPKGYVKAVLVRKKYSFMSKITSKGPKLLSLLTKLKKKLKQSSYWAKFVEKNYATKS